MFEELTFQMNNSVEKNDDFHRVEKCNCDFFFSVFKSGSFVKKKNIQELLWYLKLILKSFKGLVFLKFLSSN